MIALVTHQTPSQAAMGADATCLIAPPDRIVAATEEFYQRFPLDPTRRSLCGAVGAPALTVQLEQFFASGGELSIDLPHPGGESPDGPVRLRLTRLDGPEGPLALVTIEAAVATAPRDALTGLLDRRAIAAWVADHPATTAPYAVLFVDLDDFKRINDRLGHLVGDHILTVTAQRLEKCVRDGDLVTRFGGDEFVILLQNIATIGEVAPIRKRIVHCIAEPVQVDQQKLQVTGTIGVALATDDTDSISELIDRADRDMYAAKQRRAE